MSGVIHGADTHWIVNSGYNIGTTVTNTKIPIMINDTLNARINHFLPVSSLKFIL